MRRAPLSAPAARPRKPSRRDIRRRRYRPELIRFEEKVLPSGIVATGSAPGSAPVVHLYDAATGELINSFEPYPAGFRGGVQVAVGDVNNDGTPDIITANGAGARPVVEIFSGTDGALLGKFAVAPASYRGGVSIATGDVDGDGKSDIIVGYGQGQPWVSVFAGPDGTPLGSFLAYGAKMQGGVRVAAGDFDHDGHADIATVNASGVPEVKVFSGASYASLADFTASFYAPRGGASIGAGDVNGDRTPDLIVAQASPRGVASAAEVAVFSGTSSTPIASYSVAGGGFSGGARAAAIDVDGDDVDAIAVSPAGKGGVTILDTSGLRFGATPVAGTATPVLATIAGAGGGSLAASSSVNESTPAAIAASLATASPLTPLERLGYYDASGQFVPVAADDPRLAGKDVYVLVHGWAPGYIQWVQADAALGQTLTWWGTFPGQPGYNASISGGLTPDSDFLLDGNTAPDGIVVNPMGLAQTLMASDPNAAVLAYSWIDESATATDSIGIPEDAGVAGAKTAINGERLAFALQQALGGSAFDGTLQLIGHSFGSKVATVAAVAMGQDPTPIHVDQLTTLDSPEAAPTVTGYGIAEIGASNYNWYYIQALDVDRADASGTFVDNYISEFDEAYSTISYPGSNPDLGNVVDVQLYPEPYYGDPGNEHSYSARWYAGSASPSVNDGQTVGRLWSPLLAGNSGPDRPPASLISAYQQSWNILDYAQSNQYDLESYDAPNNSPTFNPIALTTRPGRGVTVANAPSGATVTLDQDGGTSTTYTGSFTTAGHWYEDDGIRGITFAYSFPTAAPGDTLTIGIDGTPAFVMDASLLQSPTGLGTISLGDILGDQSHTLTFTLTSAATNSTSQAVITDIRQISY